MYIVEFVITWDNFHTINQSVCVNIVNVHHGIFTIDHSHNPIQKILIVQSKLLDLNQSILVILGNEKSLNKIKIDFKCKIY